MIPWLAQFGRWPNNAEDWVRMVTDWIVGAPIAYLFVIALPLLVLAVWGRVHPSPNLLRWVVALGSAAILTLEDPYVRTVGGLLTAGAIGWLVSDWFPRIVRWEARVAARVVVGAALLALLLVTCTYAIGLLIWDIGLTAVAMLDLFTLPSANLISVSRQTQRVASLKKRHDVELTIANHSTWRKRLVVKDDRPDSWEATPEDFDLRLKPRSRMSFTYRIVPNRRGSFWLACVYVQGISAAKLWHRVFQIPCESEVKVFPDLAQLREYALLARTNRLRQLGVRRTRRIGQDNEFERLRDYTPDDNFRHIEWRATARRTRLTVKDFQANQSQRLIFMLDCGRMMTNEHEGVSLMDHAMNSLLMASYVALQQGDSVGLICFSDQVHRFVPPKSGMTQMNQLLQAVFDQHPRLVESRYDEAFLHLRAQCHKRSLVVLLTNVVDEVNGQQVSRYLSSLVGRHLPLGVLLRDHSLFDRANRQSRNETEFYQAAAAAEILNWRNDVLTRMTHQGVLAIDAFPEELTAPLVNEYLQIKARHLL